MEAYITTGKNKNKDKDKKLAKIGKQMPELAHSKKKFDAERSKLNQVPKKFGHNLSKAETYETKKFKDPKSETYE